MTFNHLEKRFPKMEVKSKVENHIAGLADI